MSPLLTFRQGVRDTLPTVFGYLGIGMAFGIVGHAAGFNPLIVLSMSLIIYAGSAQFIAVSLIAAGSPILSVVASVFLVNSRMILMSLTTAPYFKDESVIKNLLLVSFLTDESFALGMNKRHATNDRLTFAWFNASNLTSYLTWNISSLLGALLGTFIANPTKYGLGFAITAMFIGLLYLQIISDTSMKRTLQLLMVGITFVLFYLGLIVIPANFLVLAVTLVACGLGVFLKNAFF